MYTSKTSFKTTVEWKEIPWRKLERKVFKLQKLIYQASSRGDAKTVRKLQKLLMKSWSAKCIAVRRVTQDNQGKKTAGVDGTKSLSPEARIKLVGQLKLGTKAKPTRRVWIPKPGTEEKRPLGIPTMYDRALQALVKLGLEPEWEAKFEENSYGFRPGRSCHDAIEAIFNSIRFKAKYVLDADIAKCFEKISHDSLLRKLNTAPTIRRQIRAWLQAGVVDWKSYANRQKGYSQTVEGTPQGGVISPLLANIALNGMENRIKQYAETLLGYKRDNKSTLSLIRYADDFVILHENLAVIQKCQGIISEWLKDMGLELKPSKTKISHTLHEYEGKTGFNFLGFNIRQFPVGKCHSGKNTKGIPLGFKTIITPSKEKVKLHTYKIGKLIDRHKATSQEALIVNLNPVIRGWANYYSSQCSKETFSNVDAITFKQILAWAKKRHPQKSVKWIKEKYWKSKVNSLWVFESEGERLIKHSETSIKRHIKVEGRRSPYDGDWIYWSARMGKHPECSKTMSSLLKNQKGKCKQCGLFFKDGDLLEIDHIIPKSKGGKNERKNLQVLHRHCHDKKSAQDNCVEGNQVLDSEWLDANPF
jgi:RNA-directed DNA polymerase